MTRTVAALLVGALACTVIAAPAGRPPAGPATRPTTRPATQPARQLTPEQQKRLKVMELGRKAIEQLKARKYGPAEITLADALALDPNNPTNIYNMACVKAVTKRPDEALAYLERAADAGFVDFIHIENDTDLVSLRDLPRYKTFLKNKDAYQRKDADRDLTTLRQQFGDKYIYELDPANKLIFAANTDAQTLADVKRWLTMQAKSQWATLFENKPDQYIAVVLPSASDYRQLIRQPGVEGIYLPSARMLIARRLGQVMTHEFTHAMHAADLDRLDQDHPIWIVEGIASMFEAGQFEGNNLVPRDNFRLWALQSAARSKRLISLEKLFTWKQPQFVANATLGYGQASSVMLYLHDQGLLRRFYDQFKSNFGKDPTGKATLEQVTGRPLAQFEKDWIAWMVKRTPPAFNTGPQGAFLGVQFSQENDGLKVDAVVTDGPAHKAGIKAADVIVGLNELDVRDQQSLMPILKEFKPGDNVQLKVRRGDRYLQVPLVLGRRDNKPVTVVPPPKPAAESAPAPRPAKPTTTRPAPAKK